MAPRLEILGRFSGGSRGGRLTSRRHAHQRTDRTPRPWTQLKNLLRAVVAKRFDDLARLLSDAEAAGRDPFDALRRRCRAYFAFGREHPGHYRVLFSAAALGPKGIGTYGKTDHPGASSFIALVDSVQRCLDAGARPGGERDSFFLAIQLWAWMHGLIDLRISKPEMPWPAVGTLLDATLFDLALTNSEMARSRS